MKDDKLKVQIEVYAKISLWQAIKLRIAGKNYKDVVEELLKKLAEKE
jgi:hypothetical protein